MSADFEMNRIYFEKEKFILFMVIMRKRETDAFYVQKKIATLYE